MDKKATIMIAVAGVLLAGCIYYFSRKPTPMTPPTSDVSTTAETTNSDNSQPADAILYFTAKGCTSLPYVSATDENGVERALEERFPATDGYDYAIVEGTRETRTILSRFTGTCEDIAPAQTDTFQVLEVGLTQAEDAPKEGTPADAQ